MLLSPIRTSAVLPLRQLIEPGVVQVGGEVGGLGIELPALIQVPLVISDESFTQHLQKGLSLA